MYRLICLCLVIKEPDVEANFKNISFLGNKQIEVTTMSWLYEHRDQLNGSRSLAEIAYHITYDVAPYDRDDVEQDIIIALMRVKQRNDNPAYLWGVARNELRKYRFRKWYESRKFCSFDDCQVIISQGVNSDARLDAIATLATLPKRLLRIGHDRLNGRKLSEKDYAYWRRHKVKLECRQNSKEISDWEKRQILRLHDKGYSVYEIRKTTGRCYETIQRAINNRG